MTILSPCRSQYGIRSGTRAIVPSSFMISQTTPAGLSPARRARSTAASVWPGALEHAAGARPEREDVAGLDEVAGPFVGSIATWIVCARSAAEMPVVTPSRASIGDRERGLVGRLVVVGHRLEVELVAALLRQAEADEPAPVRRHEVDRLGRGELRRDRQVALVLAVGRVDHDHELPLADVLDRLVDRGERASSSPSAAHVSRGIVSRACTSRSTCLAITSASRFTSSPSASAPSVVASRVCGIERDPERAVAESRDRQAHALDRDRALLHAVAEDLGRRLDLQALLVDARAPAPRRRRGPGRSGRRAARRPAARARR